MVNLKLDPPDPSGGYKKILLEGDPISVTEIEKYFTEDNILSGKATSQYDTQVKAASATQAFQISILQLWNNGDADVTCGFRFGTGTVRFEKKLASKTGWIANLTNARWRGGVNTAFNVYSYDASPDLRYTVFGEYV